MIHTLLILLAAQDVAPLKLKRHAFPELHMGNVVAQLSMSGSLAFALSTAFASAQSRLIVGVGTPCSFASVLAVFKRVSI